MKTITKAIEELKKSEEYREASEIKKYEFLMALQLRHMLGLPFLEPLEEE